MPTQTAPKRSACGRRSSEQGHRRLAAPLALLIGGISAGSVFEAVYIDKREIKCARVGGGHRVPLGSVSLTENPMVVGTGAWMLSPELPSEFPELPGACT